jgi:hypothetical protein
MGTWSLRVRTLLDSLGRHSLIPGDLYRSENPVLIGLETHKVLPKLLKLKEWLTVAEAARHLSIMFDEEVSEPDVLRLGLDGHIALSINMVNYTPAQCGPILSKEAATQTFPGANNTTIEVYRGIELRSDAFWQPEKTITSIYGVYDLMMLGSERDDVRRRYQELTDGLDVEETTLEGRFVSRDGIACRPGTAFTDRRGRLALGHLSSLTSVGVLVVRVSEIRKFEARVSEMNKAPEKDVGQRERTTLLVIIAALAKLPRIDVSKPSSAAAAIESQTALMGARVAARTIENHLNRIPEALESKQED